MAKSIYIFCFLLNANIISTESYKILAIFPVASKSHYIFASSLMKGLAENGHNITFLASYPVNKSSKNYHTIPMKYVQSKISEISYNILVYLRQNPIQRYKLLFTFGTMLTEWTLKDPEVQKLLNSSEKFDAIILEVFFNEALLGIGYKFKSPVIAMASDVESIWTCDMVGSPMPLSYIPNRYLTFTDHMSFSERFINIMINIFERIYYYFIYFPIHEQLYHKYFDKSKPTLQELQRNVSLVMLNEHFSIHYPRPYVPNMIEIGGIHIKSKPNQLPSDIEEFLDSATNGGIYFAFGTSVLSKHHNQKKFIDIFNAFESLNYKVLIKNEISNLVPDNKNILSKPWFPQQDVLAHPNIKLFITHAGLLSTMEAINFQVPVIVIPLGGDQYSNAGRIIQLGIGLVIDYDHLTENNLKNAIFEIFNNKSYSKQIKLVSKQFKDQPMSPLKKANYWIEYIIKYNGAKHLHSGGQDLSFIEYHNVDIFIILAGIILTIIFLILVIMKKFLGFMKCCIQKEKYE